MRALVQGELISRWRMIAGLSGGVFVFMFVMGSTYESLGVGMLGTLGSHTPKAISALSGSPGTSLLAPTGWLGFGFTHPMVLVLSCAVAIALPAALIAGEVQSGRAELLFVRPRSRRAFLAAGVVVWCAAQLLVTVAMVAGVIAGSSIDSTIADVGIGPVIAAGLQSLPLYAFVAGIAFVCSSRARTVGAAAGLSIAWVVAFYFANFASGIVDHLGWLRWCSPFGYFTPVATLDGGFSFAHAAALLAATVVLIAVAAWQLDRRDLR